MNFPPRVVICTCTHHKRDHLITKTTPAGPCALCGCISFTPENKCVCGHGKKAHTKMRSGHCHECDCKCFRELTKGGQT